MTAPFQNMHAETLPSNTDISETIRPAGAGPRFIVILFAICLFFQAFMGCNIGTLVFCFITLFVTFSPIFWHGRDIYTVLCMVFGLRYTGIALLAKTFYQQPLDDLLIDPVAAYGLSALVLSLYVFSILLVRKIDASRTTSFFMFSDLRKLRYFSLICLIIGGIANLLAAFAGGGAENASGANTLLVLSNSLSYIFPAGLIAEAVYSSKKTHGETFITPTLLMGAAFIFLVTTSTNTREYFISCLLSIFFTAFLYGSLRWRHIILALLLASFFLYFISPVILYLRSFRESLTRAEMLSLTISTLSEAISDPSFYERLYGIQEAANFNEHGVSAQYDYFGNASNALNRLSYVALIDYVYSYIRINQEIGTDGLTEAMERVAPRFIFKKRNFDYSMGDYLGWEIGSARTSVKSFLNFSLPMEGLAVWGASGLLLYTLLFPFTILFLVSKVACLRQTSVMAISLFTVIQHELVEGTSDILMNITTRNIPIFVFSMAIIYPVINSDIIFRNLGITTRTR